MYATLLKFENTSQMPEKNFTLACSVLERYFRNKPHYSICSFVSSPFLSHFAVISEDKEIYKNVVSMIENFCTCLASNPNWTLTATISPEF